MECGLLLKFVSGSPTAKQTSSQLPQYSSLVLCIERQLCFCSSAKRHAQSRKEGTLYMPAERSSAGDALCHPADESPVPAFWTCDLQDFSSCDTCNAWDNDIQQKFGSAPPPPSRPPRQTHSRDVLLIWVYGGLQGRGSLVCKITWDSFRLTEMLDSQPNPA